MKQPTNKQLLGFLLMLLIGGTIGKALVPVYLTIEMRARQARVAAEYSSHAGVPREDKLPSAVVYDNLTPEMEQGRLDYMAEHNAYVRRIVQGGHLTREEKVSLGEDEVALIYQDVACQRLYLETINAEKRAEEPTAAECYLTSKNDEIATTGP